MIGEVHEWKMTEEERLAYIEKHPIRPMKQAKKNTKIDYKWRSEKAIAARKKKGLI
ncbi:hypothetical protein [Peribacillus asahii]|uniref:hypothetical protein n=1 Tax=Peribacillus asahii TaxID=228899 RepID=UPI002079EEAF|nr:hypothetical protein [Peribacillus asahii]USK61316.1 hypothetical protein LIT37_08375 [Peribacillus asahii]